MSSMETSAPSFWMLEKRMSTVPLGMRTTAFCPRRLAAHATPRPWFPSVAVKKVAWPNARPSLSEVRKP